MLQIRQIESLPAAVSLEGCPASPLPEFAFIGRSNVGKSSLINCILRRKQLAPTSSKPGRTRSLQFYEIDRRWRLVDLPGYGFAKRGLEERARFNESVSNYLLGRDTLLCTFQLIDCKIPPQDLDLEFTRWLMESAIPFVLVFTKADRVKKGQLNRRISAYTDAMSEWCEGLPRTYQVSSKDSSGRKELLSFVGEALDGYSRR